MKLPRLTGLATAITLALSLSACSALDNINGTLHKAETESSRGQSAMDSMKNGKPVTEIHQQWINPVPIAKSDKSHLPGCAVTLTRPGKVSLNEVAAFISRNCHIPVTITPDAIAALSATTGGDTQKVSGALPVPKIEPVSGMPALAGMGGATATSSAAPATSGGLLSGVFWQGYDGGLLDDVTTRLGVSWRYRNGRVEIYYLDTQTFPILFMDNTTDFASKVVSGTTSSNGSTGGSSSGSGGLTGDTNTEQTTNTSLKSSLYGDLEKTVKSMLTPGVGREFLSAGILTVTDTPQTLENIREYISDRNKELNRQVVLNVEVLSLSLHKEDQLGIDWDLVFTSGEVSGSVANTFSEASDTAMTGGMTILNGRFAGSNALVHALSEQANVSIVTQEASTTTNMSAVPIQVGTQQDYADNVTNDDTANVGSSTSISKSTVTTGFNMTMLPYILPGSQQIQLLFSLNMSDDPTFRTFTSGDSSIELMKTKMKVFSQRTMLQTGQTLVLSGFQQLNDTGDKQGVGSASFWGLGGGGDATNDKTMLVILITPTLVG
ncbi:PilN family type IVB pilus formation outer membrane protein [Salmonella enterica subsp. enterica]|nr:PilN family type IVB pilus formation outer membrane protein [Salmonella enterica subsp. enterica serovar Mikawasima]EDN7229143.1 PilN family type IVB pilus formation outer membrane protein [Salmonella enterica subsp. enterica serovar Mikawasima]